MRHTTVLIDLKSIKKNPNAGQTRMRVYGAKEITFDTNSPLPDFMEKEKDCILLTWQDGEGPTESSYILVDFTKYEELITWALTLQKPYYFNWKVNNNIQTIEHSPIPLCSFKWTNPLIRCSNCKKRTRYKKIIVDYDDLGDTVDYCPKCKEPNSFGVINLEPIQTALKRMK